MHVGGPYDIALEPFLQSGDVQQQEHARLLLDLTETQLLTDVSDVIGTRHLSQAHGPVSWPVEGVLFGPCKKPLIWQVAQGLGVHHLCWTQRPLSPG